MQMNRSNLLLKKRNAPEKATKTGMPPVNRVADRRCQSILARNFLWKAGHPNPTDKKLA
jgi:hypothetical protein